MRREFHTRITVRMFSQGPPNHTYVRVRKVNIYLFFRRFFIIFFVLSLSYLSYHEYVVGRSARHSAIQLPIGRCVPHNSLVGNTHTPHAKWLGRLCAGPPSSRHRENCGRANRTAPTVTVVAALVKRLSRRERRPCWDTFGKSPFYTSVPVPDKTKPY